MISVRLPDEIEKKIKYLSEVKKLTKSDIIKEALVQYIAKTEEKQTSYEAGKDLFGNYGSGDGDLALTYKKSVMEKIDEKHSH